VKYWYLKNIESPVLGELNVMLTIHKHGEMKMSIYMYHTR